MIRVTIEMCPRGDERPGSVREIGRMYIANVGGDARLGDYSVAVCRRNTTAVPSPVHPLGPAPTRKGGVTGYAREAFNVWRLIARAVLSAFPEERKLAAKPTTHDDPGECSDENAVELGLEVVNSVPGQLSPEAAIAAIGREAWLRGARPRGF